MVRSREQPRISDVLRVAPGPVDLRAIDTASTPGFTHGKSRAKQELDKLGGRLDEEQEKLFAEGRTGGRRSLLLVLQGLDTSGKGGTIRHVVGQMDPQGVRITAFKAPTPEERRHDFLWRIRRRLPEAGFVGAFDRSHYEDVVVVRVRKLAPRATWEPRYAAINSFEEELVTGGMRVVKCFLHISAAEFCRRQLARLEDPTKHWKYGPADLDNLPLWGAYLDAYEDALERCNPGHAPWHVIPADRKWYRNWAITRLLIEHFEHMDLGWPAAAFDVEAEKARLADLAPGSA